MNLKLIIYLLIFYYLLIVLCKKFNKKSFNEWFVLPSNYVTDQTQLQPNVYYKKGILKPDATTPTTTPSQFGGTNCSPNNYPTEVYQRIEAIDAVCQPFGDVYYQSTPQNDSTCTTTDSNNNFYRLWTKVSDIFIDTVSNTTTSGLTITSAQYGGKTCSQQASLYPTTKFVNVNVDSNNNPISLKSGATSTNSSYCQPINATCDLSESSVYSVDPGINTTNCISYDNNQSWFRLFGITSNPEILTQTNAKYNGQTCTQQLVNFPRNSWINSKTGTNSNGQIIPTIGAKDSTKISSYCPPQDALCKTDDNILYKDPGQSNTTCFNTDSIVSSAFYRKWNRISSDNSTIDQTITSSLINNLDQIYSTTNLTAGTITSNQFGGKTCTQQVASGVINSQSGSSTIVPKNKYVGVTTDISNKIIQGIYNSTSTSYCKPIDATCDTTGQNNTETNYNLSSTSLLGVCQYSLSGTSTCDNNTSSPTFGRLLQPATITSPAGSYIYCPVNNGLVDVGPCQTCTYTFSGSYSSTCPSIVLMAGTSFMGGMATITNPGKFLTSRCPYTTGQIVASMSNPRTSCPVTSR
jgi:hypothetical protein